MTRQKPLPPNVIVPRQISDTSRPVRPSFFIFMQQSSTGAVRAKPGERARPAVARCFSIVGRAVIGMEAVLRAGIDDDFRMRWISVCGERSAHCLYGRHGNALI